MYALEIAGSGTLRLQNRALLLSADLSRRSPNGGNVRHTNEFLPFERTSAASVSLCFVLFISRSHNCGTCRDNWHELTGTECLKHSA
jgi:hypothetical protein